MRPLQSLDCMPIACSLIAEPMAHCLLSLKLLLHKPDGAATAPDRNPLQLESTPNLPGQPEPACPPATTRSDQSSLRSGPWIVCSLAPIKSHIANAKLVPLVCQSEQRPDFRSARLAVLRNPIVVHEPRGCAEEFEATWHRDYVLPGSPRLNA